MAHIGDGYGSEYHLLRFLDQHSDYLYERVKQVTGAQSVDWRNHHPAKGEWKRLDFLPKSSVARKGWKEFWPTSGGQHNWDAVGRILVEDRWEWLLVEAKSYPGELRTNCRAKEDNGCPKIKKALNRTKRELGISTRADWLNGYYQYANRIAALNFMMRNDEHGRLLFVYFCGDRFPPEKGVNCPINEEGWSKALIEQGEHLGLSKGHPLVSRVHKIFVSVTNVDPL